MSLETGYPACDGSGRLGGHECMGCHCCIPQAYTEGGMTDLDEQMVERVAEVLWKHSDDYGDDCMPWSQQPEPLRDQFRPAARAAIREVLGSMVDVGVLEAQRDDLSGECWAHLPPEFVTPTEGLFRVYLAPEGGQ